MKSFEQHFAVLLFTMLYKLALTLESVDKILNCDPDSNESYRAVLSCGTEFKVVLTGIKGGHSKLYLFLYV